MHPYSLPLEIQIESAGLLPQLLAMRLIHSVAAMQQLARTWRREGWRIGCVPTMGYLHPGHLSLLHRARAAVGPKGRVVVTLYVNPTQFGPNEDLSRYPRDLKRDVASCRKAGADAMFIPSDAEMYPGRDAQGFSTYVNEELLSRSMEGASRPTHFRGVTTVVAKLFNITLPDVAVFGQKDWQQATVVKRMVNNLNFPVCIILAPTVRESDGLAMSSRNKYLGAEERAQAVILFHALRAVKQAVARTPMPAKKLRGDLKQFFTAAPLGRVDYVEFFDPDTLQPVAQVKRGTHMALAVFFGKTRLIDNGRL
jgi:pantoate--beta-alanine ligase